jgi:hypothetical protein
MPTRYSTDPDPTEKKKYRGEAEATEAEKANVGGEKTLQVDNYLFQSDNDANNMAATLLARLKSAKDYIEISSEFCAVPVELGDTVAANEFINNNTSIPHLGLVRQIRLSVTPANQTLTITLED